MELRAGPLKRFEAFQWMVKFTPQKEWIERRGILLLLAFFFGFGGGLYLVSAYFNSLWGMFIGWLIIIFGFGGFHLAYLGKPLRAWRAILRPQTSWISRGIIFSIIFIIAAGIQMILSLWAPGGAELVLRIIASVFAFFICIYTGFAMNYVRAIPFWNNPLLPVIIVSAELLGGMAAAVAIGLTIDGSIAVLQVESWVRILLSAYALMVVIYMWCVTYGPKAGKEAVRLLLVGQPSFYIPFWVGLVVVGIIAPLILAWYPFAVGTGAGHARLFVAVGCDVVGGLALRYVMLKGGIYTPLIPMR